jgi:hypothetical protein
MGYMESLSTVIDLKRKCRAFGVSRLTEVSAISNQYAKFFKTRRVIALVMPELP